MALPNKDELKEIQRAVTEAGMLPEAVAVAVKAFSDGEVDSIEQIDSWCALRKLDNPDLWQAPAATEDQAGQAGQHDELAELAFVKNNMTARGRLIKKVGQLAADELARAHGLRHAADPRRGKKPVADDPHTGTKEQRDNCFTWAPGPKTDAEIQRVLRTLPTSLIKSLCQKAGTDLAGRPLRRSA